VPPRLYDGYRSVPPRDRVVTIGNFDGVHLGHQALLRTVVERARALGVPATAYTFHPTPAEVLRPEVAAPRLQEIDDRLAGIAACGIDEIVVERFDRDFAAMDPATFAARVLRDGFGAREVVVGWDFRFGKDRGGDATALQAALDVPVVQFAQWKIGDELVSSSRIRASILDGDVAAAARLLGRPYTLAGPVVHGDHRGRTIGFPTPNVQVRPNAVWPAYGVYAIRARHGEDRYDGVANLGVRPTFGTNAPSLEAHLFDADADLYGERLEVGFVARIRGEKKFAGLDALVAQIREDAAVARALLG
jgi:riboflavin kinase/FMN adenylyltransferase